MANYYVKFFITITIKVKRIRQNLCLQATHKVTNEINIYVIRNNVIEGDYFKFCSVFIKNTSNT